MTFSVGGREQTYGRREFSARRSAPVSKQLHALAHQRA